MKQAKSKVVLSGEPVWSTYFPDGYVHAVGRDNSGEKTDYKKVSEEELSRIPQEVDHFCKLIADTF